MRPKLKNTLAALLLPPILSLPFVDWDTNYPYWYPWGDATGASAERFRFTVSWSSA